MRLQAKAHTAKLDFTPVATLMLIGFLLWCLIIVGCSGNVSSSHTRDRKGELEGESELKELKAAFTRGKVLWQERDYLSALGFFLRVVQQSDKAEWHQEIAELTGGAFQVRNLATGKDPVFSPDGKQIAFVSDTDGDWEIYIIGCDGKNLRQLTCNDASDTKPQFSPDGKQLAFTSDREGSNEIYSLDLDNGKERYLAQSEGFAGTPTFSPDGKRIAFFRWTSSNATVHLIDTENGKEIELKSDKTWNYDPYFSSDGKKMIFLAWNQDYSMKSVIVADSDGSDQKVLYEGARLYPPPQFSPESKMIAIVEQDGFYLIRIDGKSKERISYKERISSDWVDTRISNLSFSPDGGSLLFTVASRSPYSFWPVDANPPDEVRLISLDSMRESRVASSKTFIDYAKFSPNGKRILLSSRGFRLSRRLYLVNPDGSELVELLKDPRASDTSPFPYGYEEAEWQGISIPIGGISFSPDGQSILFIRGRNQICFMDVEPLKPVPRDELAARLKVLLTRGKMAVEKTDLAWRRIKSTSAPTLCSLAESRGIRIGTDVYAEPLRSDALYAATLAKEFSMMNTGYALKLGYVCSERERYDFSDADMMIDFAESHGMRVRGQGIVWYVHLPRWLIGGNWSRDELISILKEYITTVVGRYRGRVAEWDIVSEAVADDGSLRDTFWSKGIGPEYIEMAFRWAHEADPDALLFYSDFGGEGLGRKSDGIYTLVQNLVERGVPIHGVGLQMHYELGRLPKPQDVAANMDRLSKLGIETYISEMDVMIKGPVTEDKLAAQARAYREMLEVSLSAQNCKSFWTWDFTDCYSWIPEYYSGYGAAVIFDEFYLPKPAYNALIDALSEVK